MQPTIYLFFIFSNYFKWILSLITGTICLAVAIIMIIIITVVVELISVKLI